MRHKEERIVSIFAINLKQQPRRPSSHYIIPHLFELLYRNNYNLRIIPRLRPWTPFVHPSCCLWVPALQKHQDHGYSRPSLNMWQSVELSFPYCLKIKDSYFACSCGYEGVCHCCCQEVALVNWEEMKHNEQQRSIFLIVLKKFCDRKQPRSG